MVCQGLIWGWRSTPLTLFCWANLVLVGGQILSVASFGASRGATRLRSSVAPRLRIDVLATAFEPVPFPVRPFRAAETFLRDRALDWMGTSDLDSESFQRMEGDDECFPCESIRRLPQFVGPIFFSPKDKFNLWPCQGIVAEPVKPNLA